MATAECGNAKTPINKPWRSTTSASKISINCRSTRKCGSYALRKKMWLLYTTSTTILWVKFVVWLSRHPYSLNEYLIGYPNSATFPTERYSPSSELASKPSNYYTLSTVCSGCAQLCWELTANVSSKCGIILTFPPHNPKIVTAKVYSKCYSPSFRQWKPMLTSLLNLFDSASF